MNIRVISETDNLLIASYKGRTLTIQQPDPTARWEGLKRAIKVVDKGGPAGPRARARKLNFNLNTGE